MLVSETDHHLVGKVIRKITSLATAAYDIHLCWVSSGRVGVSGNERIEQAAEIALNYDITSSLILHSDLKPALFSHIKSKCVRKTQITNFMKLSELWVNHH